MNLLRSGVTPVGHGNTNGCIPQRPCLMSFHDYTTAAPISPNSAASFEFPVPLDLAQLTVTTDENALLVIVHESGISQCPVSRMSSDDDPTRTSKRPASTR